MGLDSDSLNRNYRVAFFEIEEAHSLRPEGTFDDGAVGHLSGWHLSICLRREPAGRNDARLLAALLDCPCERKLAQADLRSPTRIQMLAHPSQVAIR